MRGGALFACVALTGCNALFVQREIPHEASDEDLLTFAERDLNGDGDLFEEEGGFEEGSDAPMLDEVLLPTLRPLGQGEDLVVRVSDDVGLQSVAVLFRFDASRSASGTTDVVTIPAAELGEGMGTLIVSVTDVDGFITTFTFDDVVVDLAPPRVELGPTIVRGGPAETAGALSFWMGDAWVLGFAELSFGETTLTHALPAGWPSTLGELWDWSYVEFGGDELPEGTGPAVLFVVDAAGNMLEHEFELTVDATPPVVALSRVEDPTGVVLAVTAADENEGPVWIDVRARGLVVASATGPAAQVRLAVEDFAAGDLEIVAIARDQAGNEAESAPVVVTIP